MLFRSKHRPSQGLTYMKDLVIGDQVLNGNNKYDTVYSFGHYAPETNSFRSTRREWISLLKYPRSTWSLRTEPQFQRQPSRLVTSCNGGVATVINIKTVVRHGAFAPFTMSGTIAVNGFAAFDLHNDKGVLTVGSYKTPLSMQFMAHVFQSPHRLVCKASPLYCRSESYDENGVSALVAGPLALAEWVIQQHVVMMMVVLVPCFVLGLFLFGIEVLLSGTGLLLLSTMVASLVLVCSVQKK